MRSVYQTEFSKPHKGQRSSRIQCFTEKRNYREERRAKEWEHEPTITDPEDSDSSSDEDSSEKGRRSKRGAQKSEESVVPELSDSFLRKVDYRRDRRLQEWSHQPFTHWFQEEEDQRVPKIDVNSSDEDEGICSAASPSTGRESRPSRRTYNLDSGMPSPVRPGGVPMLDLTGGTPSPPLKNKGPSKSISLAADDWNQRPLTLMVETAVQTSPSLLRDLRRNSDPHRSQGVHPSNEFFKSRSFSAVRSRDLFGQRRRSEDFQDLRKRHHSADPPFLTGGRSARPPFAPYGYGNNNLKIGHKKTFNIRASKPRSHRRCPVRPMTDFTKGVRFSTPVIHRTDAEEAANFRMNGNPKAWFGDHHARNHHHHSKKPVHTDLSLFTNPLRKYYGYRDEGLRVTSNYPLTEYQREFRRPQRSSQQQPSSSRNPSF